MKVAYLVNQYPRTSHSFIRREIRALEALGVEVLRFSVRPAGEEPASDEDLAEQALTRVVLRAGLLGHLGASAARLARQPLAFARALRLAVALGWRSDRGLLRHLVYLAEACVLARWLERAGAQHLHAHFGTNPAALAALCGELGAPRFSFTVHGPEEFDKPQFIGLREKVRRAAFVVAVSSFGKSQLFRWVRHADWPKVQVVRCGVGDELLRAPLTPVPQAPRLACVARLSEQKGHLLLLEAAGHLAREGIPFELVLAGDGPLRAPIEALVARLGLGAQVRLAGWMSGEEVRQLILSSRALVLPSFAEGLPVVVMEALALGRPVITSAVAGIPELVETGVTGWLVPAGSVEGLVRALREAVAAAPGRLEEMGRAGAALVAAHHDAGREAGRLKALFEAAVAGQAAGQAAA
ncbi:MAG: glycosyltransferase [Deltaproteobacteria bacterium]|nr:glycosyltransferase [Deltaproteobacteria bacterium]